MPSEDTSVRPPPPGFPPSANELEETLNRIRSCCQESARLFVEEWSPRILKVIRRHYLTPHHELRQVLDSFDMLQETWMSFFAKLDKGWTCADGEELLSFILTLTKYEFLNAYHFHITAAKRSLKRVEPFDIILHDCQAVGDDPVANATFNEKYEAFLKKLMVYQKLIVRGRLAGVSLPELATRMGISLRSAERYQADARQQWEIFQTK